MQPSLDLLMVPDFLSSLTCTPTVLGNLLANNAIFGRVKIGTDHGALTLWWLLSYLAMSDGACLPIHTEETDLAVTWCGLPSPLLRPRRPLWL